MIPKPINAFCGGFHQLYKISIKTKNSKFCLYLAFLTFQNAICISVCKIPRFFFTFSQLTFYIKCFLYKQNIYKHVLGFLLVFEIILFPTQFFILTFIKKCLNFPNTEGIYRNFLPQLNDTYKIVSLEIFRCMFMIRI